MDGNDDPTSQSLVGYNWIWHSPKSETEDLTITQTFVYVSKHAIKSS